jgi:hypothetical protein
LQLQLKVKPVQGATEAMKSFVRLSRAIQQTAWLAQYGGLVGHLQLDLLGGVGAAAKPAFEVALRPPMQLRALRLLHVYKPGRILSALDPSRLTALQVQDAAGDTVAGSALACAALARLTGLQQLSWSKASYAAHDSLGAALAGMPHLTQLVLHPRLSHSALAQLPSQLVQLQLTDPDCEAAQLVTHVRALQQLQILTLLYHSNADATVSHKAAWAALKVLKWLDLNLSDHAVGGVASMLTAELAAGIASATSVTGLHISCSDRSAGVDIVGMLSPLKRLESLQLCVLKGAEQASFGDLFSKHLTRLQRLTLDFGRLRQAALAQLCFQATQLTQLVLDRNAVDDAGLEVIGHGMMPLQQLAVCNCNNVSAEGLQAALGMPSLCLLRQLACVDLRQSWRLAAVCGIEVPVQRVLVQIASNRGELPYGFVGAALP